MHKIYLLGLILCFPIQGNAAVPPPADYLSRLRATVGQWKAELPALKQSATAAANKVISGGHLYLTGPQRSFPPEALGRSGGLALCRLLTGKTLLQANDTVLAGALSQGNLEEVSALKTRVETAGAQLVLFSNDHRAGSSGATLFPSTPFELHAGAGTGVESLSNVTGLWLWIGEFINASVHLGKMPTIFESGTMPGGTARDNLLGASPFHLRNISQPGEVPDLALAYLDSLETSLGEISRKNGSSLRQGSALLSQAHSAGKPVIVMSIGHMFPDEFSSNPLPDWIKPAPKDYLPTAESLTLYLGYQWFPWDVASLIGPARVSSIIVSSQQPTPDWSTDAEHIYIDPCWEVQDAAVAIPGYDVKIMPLSGILESAIFWELIDGIHTP